MKKECISTLIRGLVMDLTGKPRIVITERTEEGAIPDSAMKLEIGPDENRERAAETIRGACEAWKKSAANSGLGEGQILVPSCVSLKVNGKLNALYWIDRDLDSARKRQSEKDAAPRKENTAKTGTVLVTEDRAAVVKNRIALVTGGAQGIGEEIVRNLAAAGALVFIADLNLEGARKLADDINAAEGRTAALAVGVNVSDEASVEAMFKTVAETAGGLDLCVSNAGVLKAGSVLEQELADFKFVTDINYTGFFVISKYAGRLLRTQHYTAPRWKTDIVQINSKSGLEGSNKNGAYAGSKFGSIGLVQSFAVP